MKSTAKSTRVLLCAGGDIVSARVNEYKEVKAMLINGLFWITLDQLDDILVRGGRTIEEAKSFKEREEVFSAQQELERHFGNVSSDAFVTHDVFNHNDFNMYYFDISNSLFSAPAELLATATADLASSVSSDMLGLMHERTGHCNKRTLIECVKSRLVSGLKIEDKDIRKYQKSNKTVCDICARSKITRKLFQKVHSRFYPLSIAERI